MAVQQKFALDMPGPGDSRPVPDPTLLTTQQLLREIGTVRELFDARLAAVDRSISVLQSGIDRVVSQVSSEVGQLRDLHSERFKSIEVRFIERDKWIEQHALANGNTISEMKLNFSKQIDQGTQLLQEVRRSTETQISDLKSRVDKAEGRSRGIGDGWGYLAGAIGLAIALISVLWKH